MSWASDPRPLLLGRVSASLATGLGSQDPQVWLFAPGGMGSEALGGMGSEAHGPGNECMGI